MKALKFKDRKVWFTSDTHYDHINICKGTTKWEAPLDRCRDFETLEAMNDMIVNNINAAVGQDDVLFHLGDWSFNGEDNIQKFRERINCKEVHLILGNHDQHIHRHTELFASVSPHREITVNKQRIVLCHFAHRVWNKSHDGAWMLYGHSHGTLPELGKSTDVGIDAHPEFRPFSFSELKELLDARQIELVDHHDDKTEQQPKR